MPDTLHYPTAAEAPKPGFEKLSRQAWVETRQTFEAIGAYRGNNYEVGQIVAQAIRRPSAVAQPATRLMIESFAASASTKDTKAGLLDGVAGKNGIDSKHRGQIIGYAGQIDATGGRVGATADALMDMMEYADQVPADDPDHARLQIVGLAMAAGGVLEAETTHAYIADLEAGFVEQPQSMARVPIGHLVTQQDVQ